MIVKLSETMSEAIDRENQNFWEELADKTIEQKELNSYEIFALMRKFGFSTGAIAEKLIENYKKKKSGAIND